MDNITLRGEHFTKLLGREIRAALARQGLTARRLAAMIEIHEVTMSKYLNAKIIPPASFISDCADALGISADELVGPAYRALIEQLGPVPEPPTEDG